MATANPHERHMRDRVDVLANAGAGTVGPEGWAVEDWQVAASDVPCLVVTGREWLDPQAGADGRARPEDVRRYVVSFTEPPADLVQTHRLRWDAGAPLGARLLSIVTPLTRDPTTRLWVCGAEDRGPAEG